MINMRVVRLPPEDPELYAEDGDTHYVDPETHTTLCGIDIAEWDAKPLLASTIERPETELPICHTCLRFAHISGYWHPLASFDV